jgi:hypothetical protein
MGILGDIGTESLVRLRNFNFLPEIGVDRMLLVVAGPLPD